MIYASELIPLNSFNQIDGPSCLRKDWRQRECVRHEPGSAPVFKCIVMRNRIKVCVELLSALDGRKNRRCRVQKQKGLTAKVPSSEEVGQSLKYLAGRRCECSLFSKHDHARVEFHKFDRYRNRGGVSPQLIIFSSLSKQSFFGQRFLSRMRDFLLSELGGGSIARNFLTPHRECEGGHSEACLRPRCPFALGNAEGAYDPTAIIHRIRHITSAKVGGAIVGGGMA